MRTPSSRSSTRKRALRGGSTAAFPMVVARCYTPPQRPGVGEGLKLASLAAILCPTVSDSRPLRFLPLNCSPATRCATFEIRITASRRNTIGNNHYQLALNETSLAGDRDFELVGAPTSAASGGDGADREIGDQTFAIVMVTPPRSRPSPSRAKPSSSSTAPFDARSSMERPAPHFSARWPTSATAITSTSSTSTAMRAHVSRQPHRRREVHRRRARDFVTGLEAEGGRRCSRLCSWRCGQYDAPGAVRQVVFITDARSATSRTWSATFRHQLGDSRCSRSGSDPPPTHTSCERRTFRTRKVHLHRRIGQVKEGMGELFAKLSSRR